MPRRKNRITLTLPPEFIELCKTDGVEPRTVLRGFIWAIPVLGFIGTVIGLTQAMGRFGAALKSAGIGGW